MSSETMKTAAEAAAADYKTDALERLEDRCRLILRGDCDNAAALGLLGVVAHKQGRNNLAVRLFERTIKIDAQAPQFHNNLGVALKALGNLEQAVDAYRKAVLLKPDYAEAYNNLGSALQLQGKFAEAVENYRQAVLLRPDWAETYNDMAVALSKQGSYRQAVESSARALQIKSDYPEAYNTMASALHMQAKFHEAVRSYRKAILLRPDYAEAHTNLGITLLLNAEFVEGWRQYAWRRYAGSITYPHHYQVPQWDGSSFIGKRLLVHYEQGLGDNIQFIRYLPMVKAAGGTVILEVDGSLLGLLQSFDGIDELVEASYDTKPDVEFDVCVSVLDLPGIFRTTLQTIPADVPYLYADPAKVQFWRDRLGQKGFKVAIVWAGRATHENDLNRSCLLENFSPLARIPGVLLYALQKGPAAGQVRNLPDEITVTNIADRLEDFTDAAAALENMDLIISVDTSILHLAGAMAKPVWAIMPFVPDWRWMLHRQTSPWYPTMRLFRQTRPGRWDDVFRRVAEELRLLTASAATGHTPKNAQ